MRHTKVTVIALLTLIVGLFGATAAYAQAAADNPDDVAAGQAVYEGSCAGCHGVDGNGSDRGRPLIGIAAQEPDRLVHIASVADGKGNMPAFGAQLSGDEIDQAISYVRLAFVPEVEAAAEEADVLATTGSATYPLLITGVALLLAGWIVTHHSRRRFGLDR